MAEKSDTARLQVAGWSVGAALLPHTQVARIRREFPRSTRRKPEQGESAGVMSIDAGGVGAISRALLSPQQPCDSRIRHYEFVVDQGW
jgi:hypothetical protein